MNYSKAGALRTLRSIVHELRLANPKLRPISGTTLFTYLLNEYRRHQVTEQRTCKSTEELHSVIKTYLCYLQSTREHRELLGQYYIRGERSVQETADLVGFRLPDSPKMKPTEKD